MFLILPKLRQIQTDRERILRLLILMPKSVVYDLVHRVYVNSASEEEEDAKAEEEEEDQEEEEEEEVEAVEAESQEITVFFCLMARLLQIEVLAYTSLLWLDSLLCHYRPLSMPFIGSLTINSFIIQYF